MSSMSTWHYMVATPSSQSRPVPRSCRLAPEALSVLLLALFESWGGASCAREASSGTGLQILLGTAAWLYNRLSQAI